MPNVKITDAITSVGVLNPCLRVFDIVMQTEYGTSYNSYLVQSEGKAALIECAHSSFFERYLENIKAEIDPANISYIILNHNEPDHSGCLEKLLKFTPNAKVLVSQAGAMYLKNITNHQDLPIQVVKDGDIVELGAKKLHFINAPFLHWPDSMFTWVEDEKTLFTCDFLGAHYCEPYMIDTFISYPDKYEEAFANYYNAIFSPFKPYVLKGLEKMQSLSPEFICTSHGPVLTAKGKIAWAKEQYAKWSQPHINETLTVPIFYASAYGYTAKLAECIKEGVLEACPTAKCDTYEIINHDMNELSALINTCDAFAIGSPTLNSDAVPPAWTLLSHVDALNNRKKPALVFGSYGWSGEAVPNLIGRLNGLRMNVFGDGFKVCFVPSEDDLRKAKELGRTFTESFAK